jgi:ribokinase
MSSSNGSKIVFAGGIVTDLITVTPRFPKPGETLIGSSYASGFGGKTPNQCYMTCILGGDVAMVGKVGDDSNGKDYLEYFKSLNVDVRGISVEKGCTTGSATILVNSETGENQIILVTAANDFVKPEDVAAADAVFRKAKAVVGGLEMPHDAVKAALKKGREYGATTILNAAPANKDLDPEILALTDILCVNETEAEITSGGMPVQTMEEIKVACKALLDKCPTVIVTVGAKGAVYATREKPDPVHVTTEKVDKVVDTTGAGDSFVGAFVYFRFCHTSKLDMSECISRACAVASMSVLKNGTQVSFPKRDQVSNKLLE